MIDSFLRSLWYGFVESLKRRLISWIIGLVIGIFFICLFCCIVGGALISQGR
jgi:ABC-type amino acid transport system permease subunit